MVMKCSGCNNILHSGNHHICTRIVDNKAVYEQEYNAPANSNRLFSRYDKILLCFLPKSGTNGSKRRKNPALSNVLRPNFYYNLL